MRTRHGLRIISRIEAILITILISIIIALQICSQPYLESEMLVVFILALAVVAAVLLVSAAVSARSVARATKAKWLADIVQQGAVVEDRAQRMKRTQRAMEEAKAAAANVARQSSDDGGRDDMSIEVSRVALAPETAPGTSQPIQSAGEVSQALPPVPRRRRRKRRPKEIEWD